ncbi:MAG: hypothetical protein P8I90_07030 [Glaciecola sp.]|nr:hypothetical protein [Glaciecola sp.]
MKTLCLCLLAVIFGRVCFAQGYDFDIHTDSAPLSKASDQSRKHVHHIIAQLHNYASEIGDIRLQQVLSTTNIAYPRDISIAQVALSTNDNGRIILISEPFIDHLKQFLSDELPSLVSLKNKLILSEHPLFIHALTDILLHELGHHALNAFYSDYTPPGYIPTMEFEAQAWANQIKVNVELDEEGVGKIVSLLSLLHNEFVTSQHEKRSAMQQNAIRYKIDVECDESYSQIATVLCEQVRPAIEHRFKNQHKVEQPLTSINFKY